LKPAKELKSKNLLIITEEKERREDKRQKIKFAPLWKWLLIENY